MFYFHERGNMPKIELRGNKAKVAFVVTINGMLELLEELLSYAGYKNETFIFCPIKNEDGTPGHQGLLNIGVRSARNAHQVIVRVQPGDNKTCWSFSIAVPQEETQGSFMERLQRAVKKASQPQRRPTRKPVPPVGVATTLNQPGTTTCVVKALEEAQQKHWEILELIELRRGDLEKFMADVDVRRDEKNKADQGLVPYQVAVDQALENVSSVQKEIDELQKKIDELVKSRESKEEELNQRQRVLGEKNSQLEEAATLRNRAADRLLTAEQQVKLEQDALAELDLNLQIVDEQIARLMEDQRKVLLNQAKNGLSADERRKLAAELLEGLES